MNIYRDRERDSEQLAETEQEEKKNQQNNTHCVTLLPAFSDNRRVLTTTTTTTHTHTHASPTSHTCSSFLQRNFPRGNYGRLLAVKQVRKLNNNHFNRNYGQKIRGKKKTLQTERKKNRHIVYRLADTTFYNVRSCRCLSVRKTVQ